MLLRLFQSEEPLAAFDAFPDGLVVGVDGKATVPVLVTEVFAPAASDIAVGIGIFFGDAAELGHGGDAEAFFEVEHH